MIGSLHGKCRPRDGSVKGKEEKYGKKTNGRVKMKVKMGVVWGFLG
jgi:hypothetical protein